MGTIRVSAEGVVGAPSEQTYRYLVDMREHHPKFLSPAFSGFVVESGGVGAGTVVRFKVTAGGRSRECRMEVSEPEPGRVIRESDTNSSLVTTFTVTAQGSGSRVRIATEWEGAGGIGGVLERTFAPQVMRGIYADELARLDAYARGQARTGAKWPPPQVPSVLTAANLRLASSSEARAALLRHASCVLAILGFRSSIHDGTYGGNH